jgi:hypothetical protein
MQEFMVQLRISSLPIDITFGVVGHPSNAGCPARDKQTIWVVSLRARTI